MSDNSDISTKDNQETLGRYVQLHSLRELKAKEWKNYWKFNLSQNNNVSNDK
jgi:hypothetical protein